MSKVLLLLVLSIMCLVSHGVSANRQHVRRRNLQYNSDPSEDDMMSPPTVPFTDAPTVTPTNPPSKAPTAGPAVFPTVAPSPRRARLPRYRQQCLQLTHLHNLQDHQYLVEKTKILFLMRRTPLRRATAFCESFAFE